MSEQEKSEYLKYYEDVLLTGVAGFKMFKPNEQFDEYGLRFNIDYLNSVGKNVVFLPLEFMSEYVDVVTKSAIDANDKEFIFHQIHDLDFDVEQMYESLNATAIGNLAYACLNSQDEKVKELCEKQLSAIFVKAKGKLLNALNEVI